MAISSTSVVYNLVGKDNVSRAMDSAGKSAGRLEKTMGRVGAAVAKAGALIGAVGIAEFGVHSLKAAADFQSSMTLLVTAGGESKKALGLVSQGIEKIAVSTGTSTKQLAEGMYLVEKAGFRGANGLNVLKVSAQAAKAENVDLSVMTNAVTSAMTSYHIPASKAVVITNEMVAAAGAAKTTMSEYASSLSTVLPIASAAGISFAEVGGAIATLTNHGTSAKEATQELANTIRNLQAPNNVAVNEMAQLGISSNDVATKLGKRGLTGTLEYLSQTVLQKMGKSGTVLLNTFNASKLAAKDADTELKNLPPAAQKMATAYAKGSLSLGDYRKALKTLPAPQAALLQQFATTENKAKGFNSALRAGGQPAQTYTAAIKAMAGGANGLNTTLQLTGENTGRFEANVKAVTDASKHAGSNISTWAQTQKTFNVQWDRFKAGVDVAGIKIGSLMLGPLTSFMGFLVDKVGPAVATGGKAIGGIFKDLTPAVSGAKTLVGGFFENTVGPKTKSARKAIGDIFGGIGHGIQTASKDTGDFLAGLAGKPLKPKHASTVQQIVDVQTGVDPTASAKAGANLHKLLGGVFTGKIKIDPAGLGKTIGQAILDSIVWVGKHVDQFTKALIDAMMGIDWLSIGAVVGKQAVPFIVGFIANLLDPVTIVKSIAKHPMDWVAALASFLVVGKAGGAIAKVLDRIPILRWFSPLFRGLEKITAPINDALGKVAGSIGSGFKNAFTKEFPKAAEWVGAHTGGYIGTALGVARIRIAEAAGEAGRGILTGIEKGAEGLSRGVIRLTKLIISPFTRSGSWLVGRGRDAVSGLIDGVGSRAGAAASAVGRLIARLLSPFARAGSWLVGHGSDFVSGLRSGISGQVGRAAGSAGRVGTAIRGAFAGAGRWLLSAGGDLISGLRSGISSAISGIATWIKSSVVDPIINAVKSFFGIHSPSTVMAGIGGHLISGLMKGLAQTNGTAIAKKIFGDMPSALGSLVDKGIVKVAQLSKKAVGSLSSTEQAKLGLSGGNGDQRAHSQGAAANQAYARSVLGHFGWGGDQFSALVSLWNGESGWNQNAANPTSSAYGIAQFLDSTWAGMPYGKTADPNKQIIDGLTYIKNSYGSPGNAYSAWLSRSPHWYAKGGDPNAGTWGVVGEIGPELVHFKGGAHVYDHKTSARMMKQMAAVPAYAKGGEVTAGTRSSARSYGSHLTAQISLSTSTSDIRKFTGAIIAKIRATKYSKAQADFLVNYVQQAENAALGKQHATRTAFGKRLIDGIKVSFSGLRSVSGLQDVTKTIIGRIDQAFTGQARSGLVSYTQRVNAQMTTLARARDKIAAKLAAANELSTTVTSGAKDFASITGLTSLGARNLAKEFRSKLASINRFATNIALMKKHGFSSELIAQLLAVGIDQAAPLAAQLAKAKPATVHSFNATQRAIDRSAKRLGTVAVNAQFGKSAAVNFVASLRSQEHSLETQMNRLAKVFARGVGRAFHIKGYAGGGTMRPGEVAVVGEQGPEIYVAGRSGGKVIPLPRTGHGSGRSGHGSELGDIKKLLETYIAADRVTVVQLNDKVLVKQIDKRQKINAGRGSVG